MNDLKRMGICPWYFARCVVLKYQDLEPEKVSRYYPVDVRVTELFHGENELKTRPRETPRDLPHFFEPTCERCMGAFEASIVDHHFTHTVTHATRGYIETIQNSMKTFAIGQHTQDPRFSFGMFGTFRIDIMNENGYVRAASIRENAVGLGVGEKKLSSWMRTQATAELISVLAEDLGVQRDSMIHRVTDSVNSLRGAYLHPDLVVDYAQWISPRFKILTQKLVREHFKNESQQRIQSLEHNIEEIKNEMRYTNEKIDFAFNFFQSCFPLPAPKYRLIVARFSFELREEHGTSRYSVFCVEKRYRNESVSGEVIYEVEAPQQLNISWEVAKIPGVVRDGNFIRLQPRKNCSREMCEVYFLEFVNHLVHSVGCKISRII